MLTTQDPGRLFYTVLLSTFFIRLLVADLLPMTGDEAYFITWGKYPDYGYYDHTPMVAWMLSPLLAVSDAAIWLRLPAVLILTAIGWIIYQLLKDRQPEKAAYAAMLYLLLPVNVVGVLMTTDTPLILWSFLSALCFYQAQRNDSFIWYGLAGLFLGLAFLSKFFAVLLGFAYLLYLILFVRRGIRPYLGLLILFAACLPAIGLNLYWNYHNCWNNYLFNLFNRTSGQQFAYGNLWKYLVTLAYLVTPPILYYLFKHYRPILQGMRRGGEGVFWGLFLLPMVFFLLLAPWKSIGLHWFLSFVPFLFIALAAVLSKKELMHCLHFMLPFTIVHIVALLVILALAPGLFKSNPNTYKDVVYGFHTQEILAGLDEYKDEFVFATDSYTESALLSYASRQHIMVFGYGSFHARQDEKITDFRQLQGKNILVVSYSPDFEQFRPYFDSLSVKTLAVAETEYYYALGRGFNYPRYRDEVLKFIIDIYYKIPHYLPHGMCYMYERYGDGVL